jgi:hypothetical protein
MTGLLLLAQRGRGECERCGRVLPMDRDQSHRGMSRPSPRVPLTPKEGWLSDGRQVLRFRPTRWERLVQLLEITSGALLPDQEIPLLKSAGN